MILAAKFRSVCPSCNDLIRKGDRVQWSRGALARHVDCAMSSSREAQNAKPVARPSLSLVPQVEEAQDSWAMLAMAAAATEATTMLPPAMELPALTDDDVEVRRVSFDAQITVPAETTSLGRSYRRPSLNKRPRPYVTAVTEEELNWTPVKTELFSLRPDELGTDALVRAGNLHAIVRPGMERWPLSDGGATSHIYKVYSHAQTHADTMASAAGQIVLSKSWMVGIGQRVIREYTITHVIPEMVGGSCLHAKLNVTTPHTGNEKLNATMTIMIGNDSIGSLIGASASHTASNPEIWTGEIEGMIERAILAQDVLLNLMKAAHDRVLSFADRKWFRAKGIIIKNSSRTALDGLRAWHGQTRNGKAKPTWGVWSRRLNDQAIIALCELLGANYGKDLDDVLKCKRYAPKATVQS